MVPLTDETSRFEVIRYPTDRTGSQPRWRPSGPISGLVSRRPSATHRDLDDAATRLIPASKEALQLLRSYLTVIRKTRDLSEPAFRPLVSTYVDNVAAIAIGATRDGSVAAWHGLRAARLRAMKSYVSTISATGNCRGRCSSRSARDTTLRPQTVRGGRNHIFRICTRSTLDANESNAIRPALFRHDNNRYRLFCRLR